MKFNLYEELKNRGFDSVATEYAGDGCEVLSKKMSKTSSYWEWNKGMCEYTKTFRIEVWFNPAKTWVQVYYYDGVGRGSFKNKVHAADKRAFNAMVDTARNNGFEF